MIYRYVLALLFREPTEREDGILTEVASTLQIKNRQPLQLRSCWLDLKDQDGRK